MRRHRFPPPWVLTALLIPALAAGVHADAIYSVVDLGSIPGQHLNGAGQVAWSTFDLDQGFRAFRYSGYGPDAGRVARIPLVNSGTIIHDLNGSGHVLIQRYGVPRLNDASGPGGDEDDYPYSARAFVFDGAQTRDLGTLGGSDTYSTSLNAAGQVAGRSQTADGATHAFLYSGGQIRDLGTLGGAYSGANVLNDRGQVAGSSETAAGRTHAFLYSRGRMRDLGTLGGSFSTVGAINVLGQVAGVSETADGSYHVFVSGNGGLRDLGSPGDDIPYPYPTEINAAGQVLVTDANGRAFLYSDGQYHRLTLGGDDRYAAAGALNAQGQVVGTSELADGSYRAFIFRDGAVHDLNDLIPPEAGWTLTGAGDINDAGQILASGYQTEGSYHTVLLTPAGLPVPAAPVPEPTALALLGLAAIFGARRGARRSRRG